MQNGNASEVTFIELGQCNELHQIERFFLSADLWTLNIEYLSVLFLTDPNY